MLQNLFLVFFNSNPNRFEQVEGVKLILQIPLKGQIIPKKGSGLHEFIIFDRFFIIEPKI